jgi:hypothetical protein
MLRQICGVCVKEAVRGNNRNAMDVKLLKTAAHLLEVMLGASSSMRVAASLPGKTSTFPLVP